jgi:acyl-CoA hydrolase
LEVSIIVIIFVFYLFKNRSHTQIGLPNAVLASLSSHRDLGVHTEMFSDGMLDLIDKGVINNRKKQYFRNQIVASFCMGTRRLYDFIHDNPMLVMQRLSDANDPAKIARNNNIVAINSAVEIDLTGQVCVFIIVIVLLMSRLFFCFLFLF